MKNDKTKIITPVLLAGGSGARLWPISRKSYPKQFSKFLGDESLFQATAQRLSTSKHLQFDNPITVTNSNFRFIVSDQLNSVEIDSGPILIEPSGKNTAPAILAATLLYYEQNPETILLVAPSDHVIPNHLEFHIAIKSGLKFLEKGNIVTFGIKPDRPETGYGYLKLSGDFVDEAVKIESFIEKPDRAEAEAMIENGGFWWNSGIYLFKVKDIIEEFKQHCEHLIDPVQKALKNGVNDLKFFRLASDDWAECQDISIDYAIMEKSSNIVAVPFNESWSDLGGWDSVWQEGIPNDDGMVVIGNATSIDCSSSLLRAESSNQHLVGLGLDNLIAVAMPDAVLIADKTRAQEIKGIVKTLKNEKISQAEEFPRDYRPWGWFESISKGQYFQVKRILINPSASISLQSHKLRSEHWVVVKGIAKVTIDDIIKNISFGESVFIPQGSVHRLENETDCPVLLIEVQTGSYLGEDDIVRYEDQYARE